MTPLFWHLVPTAGTVIALLVQVTVVTLLPLAVSHVALRRRPAARHAVLLLALLAVATAPLWRLAAEAVPRPSPADATPPAISQFVPMLVHTDVIAETIAPSGPGAPRSLPNVIAVAWCFGSLVLLLRFAASVINAQRLARAAVIRTVPGVGHVLVSADIPGPVSVGILRPVVILPADLVDQLAAAQLRQVLEHEQSHVRRRDHLVLLLERLVAATWWPHPLVHLLNRSLDAAREQRCDNDVLAAGHDRLDYAGTLLRVATWMTHRARPTHARIRAAALTSEPLALGLPRRRLERRVTELLDERRNLMTRASFPVVCAAAGVLTAVAVLTSMITGVARADAPASPPSTAAAPATSPASAQQPPNLTLHLVPVELGEAEFAEGDSVTIDQVWCTGQTLGPGEICIVRGRYTLASRETADLCLFTTSRRPSGPTPVDPRQRTGVTRGSGTFELRTVLVDGYPHVSFYNGNAFGGVYFGQGDMLLRHKGWSYKDGDTANSHDHIGSGEKK